MFLSRFTTRRLFALGYISFICLYPAASSRAAQDDSSASQRPVMSLRETYINAEKVYQRAGLYLSQNEYSDAIATLKSGLSLVGESYFTPAILDDTGTRLTLAQIEERSGNLKGAAQYFQTVLRNRLQLLRERIE